MIARLRATVTQPPQESPISAARADGHVQGGHGAHELADRMGIGVSLTCAVHCVAAGALSVVPSFASFGRIGEGHLGDLLEWMETPLLAVALLVGLYSLVPAYRNEHKNPQPLGLFLLGVAQLVASRLVEGPLEIGLTVVGVTFVAAAHLVNLRACARAHAAVATCDGQP